MVTKVYGTQGVDKVQDNVIATADLQDGAVTAAKIAIGVAGTGPAFSAYTDADTQSISNATWTKVILDTEEFDTNSNFASSRFTPTVAGYYQINGQTNFGGISASGHQASSLYKNGARYKDGSQNPFDATDGSGSVVSALLYFNGSTDYVELYIFQRSGASRNANVGNIARNYFDGCLVRAA